MAIYPYSEMRQIGTLAKRIYLAYLYTFIALRSLMTLSGHALLE